MIRGGNLLLETRDSKQTNFHYINKRGAGVGGINDLMHWSEGTFTHAFCLSCVTLSCLEKAIIFRHFLSNAKRK